MNPACLIGILALAQASTFHGPKTMTPTEIASARRFVQDFYDWYTPKALSYKNGPASDLAIKSKSALFNPQLVHALRNDSAARAKARGDIVGLDFDPFLNTQDPEEHYWVGRIESNGDSFTAGICSLAAAKSPTKTCVDVKLERLQRGWRIANFIYPNGHDLLGILKQLQQARMRRR
jgi:hypothetical protein